MAHMIEENQMAYRGARPWHGLGVEVPENATGAEMLKLARLDWKVELRDLFMNKLIDLPVCGACGGLRPSCEKCGGGPRVPAPVISADELAIYKAVVRADTSKVFQVATTAYQIVQNEQVVDFFREYCEAGHAKMETVGALRGGAVIWALAKLSDEAKADLGKHFKQEPGAGRFHDKLNGYLLLASSHDGTMATTGRATQVRVVCNNTLTASLRGQSKSTVRISHTRKWTPAVAQEAQDVMGMAIAEMKELNRVSEILAGAAIDDKGFREFMTGLIGKDSVENEKGQSSRMFKDIETAYLSSPGSELPSADHTLWGAVNGVTYFSDHERGRTQDSRMANSWFGDGERLKRSALSVAMAMAGVN